MPSDIDEIELFITDDGSVGLYNNRVKDIYHSKNGAYSESMDKFVKPAGFENFLTYNEEVKILDICYGMGYNTKSTIQKIFEIKPKTKITIDAIEKDKSVILLSGITNENIYGAELNLSILNKIYNQKDYFKQDFSIEFFHKLFKSGAFCLPDNCLNDLELYKYSSCGDLISFLHNIYYHYVSNRINKPVNAFKFNNFVLQYKIDDARKIVPYLKTDYDFIFLDAFTPKLQPALWSFEFFKELHRILKPLGRLLTYSSAAPVRSAMLESGFYVYKNIDKSGKSIGTIATKYEANDLIILDEKETGLLKTKSGIFYRDKNLNNSTDDIIKYYEEERKNSNRQTASSYLKKIGEKTNV